MKYYRTFLFIFIIIGLFSSLFTGCISNNTKTREEAIPDNAVKLTPEEDLYQPIMHSEEWQQPVPMEGPINTAGIEDSPFISSDGSTFFFWFTPDTNASYSEQLVDGVTGIWWSHKTQNSWEEPTRVILSDSIALDGAPFYQNDMLWFGSIRQGNYGEADVYTAIYENNKWTEIRNAGEMLNKEYDVGEFHITKDGQYLYCDKDGTSSKDLYVLEKTNEGWSEPTVLPYPINTDENNEVQPFVTDDQSELWFTSQSRNGYIGPAIFRCQKDNNGSWGQPVEIVSNLSGEPTIDKQGNLYFVHFYYTKDIERIEADIYVAYHK